MKFSLFLIEAVQKNEINDALRDPNFKVGLEFEFLVSKEKLSKFGHLDIDEENFEEVLFKILNSFNFRGFNITDDPSVKPSNSDELGVEVVTPPVGLNDSLKITENFFALIRQIGLTNDTCGLHVNISHDKYPASNINKEALTMGLEDKRIYKSFSGREDNPYVRPSEKDLRSTGTYRNTKSQTLNIKGDYVEFRAIGGKDYENKWEEVRKIMLNYAVKYKQAASQGSEFKKKDILKKGINPEKRKEFFDQYKQDEFGWSNLVTNYFSYIEEWFDSKSFLWRNLDILNNLTNSLIKEYDKDRISFNKKVRFIFKFPQSANFMNYLNNNKKNNLSPQGILLDLIKNIPREKPTIVSRHVPHSQDV